MSAVYLWLVGACPAYGNAMVLSAAEDDIHTVQDQLELQGR